MVPESFKTPNTALKLRKFTKNGIMVIKMEESRKCKKII